ncbi:MAG: bifunctional DNA-formamidopyrimidine glycosylase/DNA-(apurinic or apyrimidinic site) lyase [Candidatus Eisenbacteria bacterium]|uniref:Bifunctional DNA-formamidopyrimidine glycosylase/DNA-(Apurinic or apyrimidinic site) lyase n=1 Tax=Eiseniibacteriota bacterium TaxID=2212470 RepID=A0A937X6C9_UNCEI|nr:bifunctional DNA-formamidopyrimidine glycosylase/DNA-(apurinic or apyrimidinic site) lyase [Candidatus Eisenbacteria bacterium]
MPELPEVETIVRRLRGDADRPALIGRAFTGAAVLWPPTVSAPSPRRFAASIVGRRVEEIGRRGKFIVLSLNGATLLFHLRMGGGLAVERAGAPLPRDARLVLSLDDGQRLVFRNARKFGRAWLVADPAEVLGRLGPEPLDDRFRAADLGRGLRDRRRQLKPLLLDQAFLAGVGNIYADEALHRAGLHPSTDARRVSVAQAERLWRALRRVLRDAIRHNGTTFDSAYEGGGFGRRLRVYGRAGGPCRRCGAAIRRIVVGGRGTHFCPRCQPR